MENKCRTSVLKSPIALGCIYLLLIPLFGGIYSCMPGEFYHSTALHEPTTDAALERVLQQVQKELRSLKKREAIDDPTITVDFETAEVLKVTPVGDTLDVLLRCQQHLGPSWNPPDAKLPYLQLKITFIRFDLGGNERVCDIDSVRLGNGNNNRRFFIEFFDFEDSATVPAWLAYQDAIRGFPRGNFWTHLIRMTYFSATTVTTIGYGDIVPLTDRARVFAAAEGIIGVIIIGLFVNAAAARVKERAP